MKIVSCLGGVRLERNVPNEALHDYIRNTDHLVWVDVQDPCFDELGMLLEELGFHPLALEDVAQGHDRSKVERFKRHLFAALFSVQLDGSTESVKTVEQGVLIGRNYMETVQRGGLPVIDAAMERWMRGGAMLRKGIGFLADTLLHSVIETYAPVIEALENDVEEAELNLFGTRAPTACSGCSS